ncbi:MAG: oxygen-dependent coproporphyrinogen oxidase [Bacteroidetes bacterium]|nr:oxygen-dependent coproporphyrinogen oxidase [Bacteroidota bacterium]
MPSKENISEWLQTLQKSICTALEQVEEDAVFSTEPWQRPEGGGGITRVIQNGAVLEKGGVNFSAVQGPAPAFLFAEKEHSLQPSHQQNKATFYAAGVSIVLHPKNPWVPIIHMNIRYFEMSTGVYWLGGGIDLTPHYINKNDAVFFHQTLKAACDKHHKDYYQKFKKWADDYFYITHRNETRGIGGIFFDRMNHSEDMSFEKNLAFWKEIGNTFAPLYVELIQRNKEKKYTENEINWQRIRRSRYAEFNLVYDKGTKFGLETNGRIESILMSLPPLAAWHYNYKPAPNSAEAQTQALLKKEMDWINPSF